MDGVHSTIDSARSVSAAVCSSDYCAWFCPRAGGPATNVLLQIRVQHIPQHNVDCQQSSAQHSVPSYGACISMAESSTRAEVMPGWVLPARPPDCLSQRLPRIIGALNEYHSTLVSSRAQIAQKAFTACSAAFATITVPVPPRGANLWSIP